MVRLQTRGDLLSGEHFKAVDRKNAYRQEKNITRIEKENNVVEKGHTYPISVQSMVRWMLIFLVNVHSTLYLPFMLFLHVIKLRLPLHLN